MARKITFPFDPSLLGCALTFIIGNDGIIIGKMTEFRSKFFLSLVISRGRFLRYRKSGNTWPYVCEGYSFDFKQQNEKKGSDM